MNRRTQIMQAMGKTGGSEAPGPRRKQIREGLSRGARTLPSGLPPTRYPSPRGSGAVRGPNIGGNSSPVGPATQPRLGRQLSGRVQSGAIDQAQALKVAKQRQTLKKAFGSDWRSKIYAGSGPKEIRQGGPFANRQIAAERAKGLARAKKKLY